MEHLALYDYLLAQNTSPKSLKSKHKLLFEGKDVLLKNVISELVFRTESEKLNQSEKEEVTKLLTWLFGQLNRTLKETIKYLNGKLSKSLAPLTRDVVKKMFETVIRVGNLPNDLKGKSKTIDNLLEALHDYYKRDIKI